MYLNREQERILEGEFGEGKRLAIKVLINLGDSVNAPFLFPISSSHISGVSYKTGGDGLIETLKRFSSGNSKVVVKSTLNPCGIDINNFHAFNVDKEFLSKQQLIIKLYKEMGVIPTLSCVPYYYINVPNFGEHISWAESNAVVYSNSVLGARTNKEGSISALASAVIGETPYYGLHVKEERKPKLYVKYKKKVTLWESQLIGAYVGNVFGAKVPIFDFIPLFPYKKLNRMGAALTAYGDTAMFHLKGVTPEWKKWKEKLEYDVEETFSIEKNDLDNFSKKIEKDLYKANMFVIGCPHLDFLDLKEIAEMVKGKKLRKGNRFLLFTNRVFFSKAKESGLIRILNRSNIEIYSDTCMVVSNLPDKGYVYATDSLKALFYLPRLSRIETFAGPISSLINVAFE